MNPTLISSMISGLSGLLGAIGLAVAIWSRRISKEARELRELREINRAAFSYIYLLELAADEAARKAGVQINVQKPEELKITYLVGKADEGNKELEAVLDFAKYLRQPPPSPEDKG